MAGKTQRNADLAIDEFVERVNRSSREELDGEDVPGSLRVGSPPPDVFGRVSWTIVRAPSPCKWVDEFEAKLPGLLPRSYRSLVSRYLFPAFDVGSVMLLANTGSGVRDELVDSVFRDQGIWTPLLGAGFVQFGRPSTGSYDPVCFDL